MNATTHGFRLGPAGASLCRITLSVRQRGLPRIEILGVPPPASRACLARLRSAFDTCGHPWPRRPTLIEVGGAAGAAEEPWLDAPLALLLAVAARPGADSGLAGIADAAACGMIAADGRAEGTPGIVPFSRAASGAGRGMILPASALPWLRCEPEPKGTAGRRVFAGIRELLHGQWAPAVAVGIAHAHESEARDVDGLAAWGSIVGQEGAMRALAAAVAGGHSCLLWGPPGCGKTSLAKGAGALLPPLGESEWRSLLASCSLRGSALPRGRAIAVVTPADARAEALPSAWALSTCGWVVLEELDRHGRDRHAALLGLLECPPPAGAGGLHDLGAHPLVIATSNRDPAEPRRGLPDALVDRFSMCVALRRVDADAVLARREAFAPGASADQVRAARERQRSRAGMLNACLPSAQLPAAVPLARDPLRLLRHEARERELSARAVGEVRRVARSLADLDGCGEVAEGHVVEALGWRVSRPPARREGHSIMPGANPRRIAFSQHTRGSTNCRR